MRFSLRCLALIMVFAAGTGIVLAGCGLLCPETPPGPEGEAEGEGSAEGAVEAEGEGRAEGEGTESEGEGGAQQPYVGDHGYTIVAEYPHDPEAFTQGLAIDDGILYEGTGLTGRSSLREVDLLTGVVVRIYDLERRYFGEGITVYENRIVQLTWRSHTGFVYAKDSFERLEEFAYATEGWGLTHDGARLIMSDGTSTLYCLDPVTFAQTGTISVRDGGEPVVRLNELEYVQGEIYANVWKTDRIARIDPATGDILGRIHLEGLLTADEDLHAGVLNGIAYDPEQDRLFVTGKLWPTLFEIRLVPLK